MVRQKVLFPEMEEAAVQSEPRGFIYRDEVMTEKEEAALVESLGKLDFKPFEFHGPSRKSSGGQLWIEI